jgi:hypothetical protein
MLMLTSILFQSLNKLRPNTEVYKSWNTQRTYMEFLVLVLATTIVLVKSIISVIGGKDD